jgi:hypothetical protein
MQRAADRQKTLFAHGELISDKRLRIQTIDWRQTPSVEGRVPVHGENEHSGMRFLMLETTSARVFYISYTREMEEVSAKTPEGEFVRSPEVFRPTDANRILWRFKKVLSNRPLLRAKFGWITGLGSSPPQ